MREAVGRTARVAWALRGLFDSPETTALPRATRTEAWCQVLRHAIDGDLQAALDEHSHVLMEAQGLQDKPPAYAAETLAESMTRALRKRLGGLLERGTTVGTRRAPARLLR